VSAWSYRYYRTELKASELIQRTRSHFWVSAWSYRQDGTGPYRANSALLQLAGLFFRLATPHSFRASYCNVFLAGDILTSHATMKAAYKNTSLLRTYIKFLFGIYRLLYPEDLEFLRKVNRWGITCHEYLLNMPCYSLWNIFSSYPWPAKFTHFYSTLKTSQHSVIAYLGLQGSLLRKLTGWYQATFSVQSFILVYFECASNIWDDRTSNDKDGK
jgi:hypothetical protein